MQITRSNIQRLLTAVLMLVGVFMWVLSSASVATAGTYAESAHGNTSYGVNRSGTECPTGTPCPTGDCAHCHDTFNKAICGVNELMFFAPYGSSSQTDNFCFECHKGTGSVQDPLFNNYNYSYRASGDTSITCPDDILEAFSFINESGSPISNCGSIYGTSHKLTDIKTFVTGKWGYAADSNPCTACHNPHPAQRDPHTTGNRGWLVSRPSGHTDASTWKLWGDDLNERMDQYSTYQAPNAASGYEPDGSGTTDGSNLTDYVTFCTDCHNNSNTIYSTLLGRDLYTFDWATEKHGGGAASDSADYTDLLSPYQDTQCGTYVLACTDCHEPHGAPNIFLTRQKVNNGPVSVTTGSQKEWANLCGRCHAQMGHLPDRGPDPDGCLGCHGNGCMAPLNDGPHQSQDGQNGCKTCHDPLSHHSDLFYKPCTECHYHGGIF